ncbi:MAG: TlpA family protein disulfide reductase [Alphaproteobacteria bacterium]|nr:TlpA family protein disulfide reductase [Alphaproteobacteria bacterium]
MLLLVLAACSSAPAEAPPLPGGFHPVAIDALRDEIGSRQARPRIYNFWATWCGPCMRELPDIKRVADSRDDVELVLVNVDMPSLHDTKVKATLERLGLAGFRSLGLVDPDPAGALNQLDGWPNSVPVTLLVAADGTRAKQFNVSVDEARLNQAVDSVVAR